MGKKSASSSASPAPAAAPAGLIAVGKAAPAFKLNNQAGESTQLKDFKGTWIVLYFYPKDDTPGCTAQACGFRDQMKQFTDRGAVVLGISPDDVKSHAKFAGKHELPFDLLADADHAVCEAFGVWQEKSMYGKKYLGVVRTTYLIDPAGKVAHRWDKVKVEGHDADVLAKLDELK